MNSEIAIYDIDKAQSKQHKALFDQIGGEVARQAKMSQHVTGWLWTLYYSLNVSGIDETSKHLKLLLQAARKLRKNKKTIPSFKPLRKSVADLLKTIDKFEGVCK